MILGIDYGKKKIGLAVSEGAIATPLRVVKVVGLEDTVKKVKAVIREQKIEELVIGVPESGEATSLVRAFINIICRFVKVVEADETLSSKEAIREMIRLGKGKKDRSMEDAYSAAIILQKYLDEGKKF